jgi:uncharacterized protein
MPASPPKILRQRETLLYTTGHQILRLNVGFLLKEGIGYSRDFIFDEPLVQVADDLLASDLRGTVTLTRTPQGLYVQAHLSATVQAECVRCLAQIEQPVGSHTAELFVYPPENAPPRSSPLKVPTKLRGPKDALFVGDDMHLDLAPLVREDMLLSVPIHALCRPDCRGLCPECGQNWNEGPCTCAEEQIDSRWAALAQWRGESSEPSRSAAPPQAKTTG